MKYRLPSFNLSLRSQLALSSLLGLTIMAAGSIILLTQIWKDLSRTFGITTLERELSFVMRSSSGFDAIDKTQKTDGIDLPALEIGTTIDWGFQTRQTGSEGELRWLKQPADVDINSLNKFGNAILDEIRATQLTHGSFELQNPDPKKRFFIVFAEQKDPYVFTIFGTRSHLDLSKFKPWAAPFLSFLVLSYLIYLILTWFISKRLTASYARVHTSLDFIRAGRFQNLDLPRASDPEISALVETIQQTAEMLRLQNEKLGEVSKIANEDPMTGLPNYRRFIQFCEAILKSELPLGQMAVLVIIDLDFFKKVNDNHEHSVGDLVLRSVANIITQVFRMSDSANFPDRSKDFCARYGGEEFVGVLPMCDENSGHIAALRLVEKLRGTQIEVPAQISNTKKTYSLSVTASVGLAYHKRDAPVSSLSEWVKLADDALYQAKHQGRNRIVLLDPTQKNGTKVWID